MNEDDPITVPDAMKREWRNFLRTERRKRKAGEERRENSPSK